MVNKTILFTGIILIVFAVSLEVILNTSKTVKEDVYIEPLPDEVVRTYFTSWSNKNYVNMYSTISDGFKQIEPTAKDLSSFREYVASQGIKSVHIISITQKSNDGGTAVVDYLVEFVLEEGIKRDFAGSFTLKYRDGDVIKGWKLIHPYGENIDNS